MAANAPAAQRAVEEFVGTHVRDILAKRLRDVSILLAFLRSVQGLQDTHGLMGSRVYDLLPALERAFELVYVTRTTLDQENWILQLRRTLYRFGRLTNNAQYELVGYSSDEAEEPRVPVNIVRLLFDVPVSVDGASVWIRTRDPEASRHLFQSNRRFMTVLARCCRIVWQPETVQNMIAFYAPILETLESNFVDTLTVDVASGARTEPPPLPAPPHQPVMEETIEEKLPPHQPGSSHAHISALLSRMQAV